MFKKSLLAVAVLGTAAGLASAADVTLYGVVDTGLMYAKSNSKFTVNGDVTKEKDHDFALDSGVSSASRFGLKGTEDLGNGLKVGFVLENGFKADSGELGDSGSRLFDREASLSVYSDFGTFSFGRMGGVGSSAGTYDHVYRIGDAFDGGDNNVFGFAKSARYDNMITYMTPKFAGVQGTFQYSFKEDSQHEDTVEETTREGSAGTNRYASAALTGEFGALNTVVAYEFQNYASNDTLAKDVTVRTEYDDGHTVYLGGNYDFGFAKTFVMAQYFKGVNANQVTAISDEDVADVIDVLYVDGLKGYGLHLGAQFAALGGNTTVGMYYVDAEANPRDVTGFNADLTSLGLAAKYEYQLSKRTSVYTGAGWMNTEYEIKDVRFKLEEDVYQAYVGLTHKF